MRLNVAVPSDTNLKQSFKKENRVCEIDEVNSQFGLYEEDFMNNEDKMSPQKRTGSFMQLFTRKHSLRRMDSNFSKTSIKSPSKAQIKMNKMTAKGFDFDEMVLDSNEECKDIQNLKTGSTRDEFHSKVFQMDIQHMKENFEQQIHQLKEKNKELEIEINEMASYAASFKIQMAEIQTYKDKIYLKCSKKIKEYRRVLQEKAIENIELTAKLQIAHKKLNKDGPNNGSSSKKNITSNGGQTNTINKGLNTDRPHLNNKIGGTTERKTPHKNTPQTSRVPMYKGLDLYKNCTNSPNPEGKQQTPAKKEPDVSAFNMAKNREPTVITQIKNTPKRGSNTKRA